MWKLYCSPFIWSPFQWLRVEIPPRREHEMSTFRFFQRQGNTPLEILLFRSSSHKVRSFHTVPASSPLGTYTFRSTCNTGNGISYLPWNSIAMIDKVLWQAICVSPSTCSISRPTLHIPPIHWHPHGDADHTLANTELFKTDTSCPRFLDILRWEIYPQLEIIAKLRKRSVFPSTVCLLQPLVSSPG